jgi:cutinase
MFWTVILPLAVVALAASTQHEKADCSPLEVVIGQYILPYSAQHLADSDASTARGTTEPQGYGTIGGGTKFVNAVQKAISGATAYDVKYPATPGAESQAAGVQDTLKYFETRPKTCPNQLYVLSGFSQGGLVMHRAADKLDKTLLKTRVVAAVTFGDHGQQATKEKPIYNSPFGPIPVWPAEIDGRIKFNCAAGDPVSRDLF